MMCNYLRDFIQNTLPTINFLIHHWSLLVKIQDIFRQLSNNDIDDLPIATEGDIDFDELPEDFKSNIQYAAKHAIAIYPPCMLAMLNITPDVSSTAASTKQLISQEFGLESDDWMIHCDPLTSQSCTYLNYFFYLRGRNDVYKPSFYLIRDDRQRRYVLCIRGSTSVTDWITDASAYSDEFTVQGVKGKAHAGILKSAEYVYYSVIHTLRQLYGPRPPRQSQNDEENKHDPADEDYDFIITGHSLGAGVASLVALKFVQDTTEQALNKRILRKMKVYSFATPSIVSHNIAEKCRDRSDLCITSVILNTDIVSRIG
eukprot:856236_1